MKGRSNRLPPSAPLEDWGDGQWTVDCSCGVNFDDGEEMVSCDECGVWVHTRCSRYVRGEASFACHKCTPTSKGSRAVVTSAANNFAHDAEETEVAKLLIELPTKTDRPPPIPPGGAPYRPPFRLWAQVPKEERVHMQGVPGGDPSLFRGLPSKIASPDLWKCTGYVPKKFNFKYKEFPCWEEEERDKASLGADALFSLSKETVQAVPEKSSEKMLSPGIIRRKDGQNLPLSTRSFGCVKKERNKLRVAGSSKCRKGETDEKDFSGRKRSQGDSDRLLTNSKNKDETVAVFDSRKEDLSEDGRLHIAESDAPDTKSTHKRENMLLPKPSCKNLDERLNNGSKPKHMVVFKTSKKHLSDEVPRSKLSLETPAKTEKANRLDGRVSNKLNTTGTGHVDDRNIAKSFIKQEDAVKPALSLKEPKDENHPHAVPTEVITGTIMNSNFFNHGSQPDVTDVTLVPSSSASCSVSAKKAEINLKIETLNDQAIENLNFPRHSSAGKQYGKDDLPQNLMKPNTYSSITLDESKMKTSIQYEEQKPKAFQKDSDLSQSFQECIKSNREDPSLSSSLPEKVAATGKEFLKPTPLAGSNLPICRNQNSAAKATSGKNFHVVKQHSVKVTNSFKPAEDKKEQEVSPTGSEFSGSKSIQAGKTSQLLDKNHSLDLKGQSSGASFQASAGNPATSSGIAVATASPVQSPSNQLKASASGSFQKNDKTTQPNSQPASKFLGHSLVMQASTLTNSAATLSDEELALLLHQELNSSPRVPRVPRMRQVASSPFSTPISTSMLSKRSCSGGRDQVSFFRRKHKEDVSKDGSRHSRDRGAGTAESRRMSRHSPEPNQDESAIFSSGFAKRRKGSKPPNTVPSLRTNASGAPIEDVTSLAPSTKEENNARTSPANVDADASLVGRSLPCLIDEIVCKGKCSTYEELCDAVRPYWHSLRKPNGERYAYSSHSQAVLDCLRNRTEWAHLIDRGPKTTTSKRRRKHDSETPAMELEHEISGNPLKEDVPKGKRNARKRRLVGLKEAANKRYQGTLSDDDDDDDDEDDDDDDDDGDDDDDDDDDDDGDLYAQYQLSTEETGCHLSDGSGAEEPSSSSGDSD